MVDSPLIAMPEIVSPAALIARLEYVDGLYIYGLVDAAQFPELLRYAPSAIKSGSYVSLLGESALSDAILVGPLLIDLTISFQQRALALKWLLSELQHRPFVSFLTSAQPFQS